MKRLLLSGVILLLSLNSIQAISFNLRFWSKNEQKHTQEVKKSDYEKLISEAETSEGFINVHIKSNKVYLEIPTFIMDRDMLLGSTITSTSDNGNGIVGSKINSPLHFIFLNKEDRVEMRLPQLSDITENGALVSYDDAAIYKMFKIECYNNDSSSVVINATELFLSDDKYLTPIDKNGKNSLFGKKKIESSLDKEKSYIETGKSFDDNLAVKSTLSYKYTVSDRGPKWKDVPLTVGVTRSILLLDTIVAKPDRKGAVYGRVCEYV